MDPDSPADSIMESGERDYIFPDFKDSRWERPSDGEANLFEIQRIKQLQGKFHTAKLAGNVCFTVNLHITSQERLDD